MVWGALFPQLLTKQRLKGNGLPVVPQASGAVTLASEPHPGSAGERHPAILQQPPPARPQLLILQGLPRAARRWRVAPGGHGCGGSAPTRGTARSQQVPSRGAARSFRREARERPWARCCVRMDITVVLCRGGGAQILTALLFFHAFMTLSVLYSALFPPPNSFFPGYLEPSYKY